MEHTVHKRDGIFIITLRLDGRPVHVTETHFDQKDWFLNKYQSLHRLWGQEQHKAVLNRWATFNMVCEAMEFPMENGAHAAIYTMVEHDNAYSRTY